MTTIFFTILSLVRSAAFLDGLIALIHVVYLNENISPFVLN